MRECNRDADVVSANSVTGRNARTMRAVGTTVSVAYGTSWFMKRSLATEPTPRHTRKRGSEAEVKWDKVEEFPDWEFSAGLVRHTGCRKSEPGKPSETSWAERRCGVCGEDLPQPLRRAALGAISLCWSGS